MSTPPISHPGTEAHTLHSDIVGDDYEISVIPPPPGFASGPVPVVYLLDGNIQSGLASSAVRMLIATGEIAPVYVAGIGYPGGNDPAIFQVKRNRDMTSTKNDELAETGRRMFGVDDIPTGGAAAFLGFITDELRPFLAERYQVADDSTIIGHSSGALFVSWVLFHHTNAFQRYVSLSPAPLGDDDPARWEEEYAAGHSDLDAHVFLAVGTDEHVPGPYAAEGLAAEMSQVGPECTRLTRHLGAALASRNYPSLRLHTYIAESHTHFTIPGAAIPMGLRYVFAPA